MFVSRYDFCCCWRSRCYHYFFCSQYNFIRIVLNELKTSSDQIQWLPNPIINWNRSLKQQNRNFFTENPHTDVNHFTMHRYDVTSLISDNYYLSARLRWWMCLNLITFLPVHAPPPASRTSVPYRVNTRFKPMVKCFKVSKQTSRDQNAVCQACLMEAECCCLQHTLLNLHRQQLLYNQEGPVQTSPEGDKQWAKKLKYYFKFDYTFWPFPFKFKRVFVTWSFIRVVIHV